MLLPHFYEGREISREVIFREVIFLLAHWRLPKLPNKFLRCANLRCTGHATTSTERGDDSPAAVYSPCFRAKTKKKSNRSSLFPVGRRSPCATVTVINRQFDALFEIKIFLYLRLKFFQMLQCSMVKRIDRLSFDYCVGSNLPCGYRVMHARGGLESASVRVAIYNQIRP